MRTNWEYHRTPCATASPACWTICAANAPFTTPSMKYSAKYWMDGDREIQQGYLPGFLAPNGAKLKREAHEQPSLVTQWLSDKGDTTIRQIARKMGSIRRNRGTAP